MGLAKLAMPPCGIQLNLWLYHDCIIIVLTISVSPLNKVSNALLAETQYGLFIFKGVVLQYKENICGLLAILESVVVTQPIIIIRAVNATVCVLNCCERDEPEEKTSHYSLCGFPRNVFFFFCFTCNFYNGQYPACAHNGGLRTATCFSSSIRRWWWW